MEITDFITKNFISSFAGALVAVELIVFITKNFPLIKKIPTKFYTFILAIIHLIIIKIFGGNIEINIQEIYLLFINSLLIVLALCGGYDTLMDKFKNIKDTLNQAEENIAQINGVISNETTTENSAANNAVTNNTSSDNAVEVSKATTSNIEK